MDRYFHQFYIRHRGRILAKIKEKRKEWRALPYSEKVRLIEEKYEGITKGGCQ